jgi:high-affinity Fe2+/Pb2+ permease
VSPRRHNVPRLAGVATATALVAGLAAAAALGGLSRLDASLAARASSLLTLLIAALVVVVGLRAATPCASWWEGALDRHRRRRGEGRPGERTSP